MRAFWPAELTKEQQSDSGACARETLWAQIDLANPPQSLACFLGAKVMFSSPLPLTGQLVDGSYVLARLFTLFKRSQPTDSAKVPFPRTAGT
jgi:hypothetical protein